MTKAGKTRSPGANSAEGGKPNRIINPKGDRAAFRKGFSTEFAKS
jgi:hypothetical protein